MIGPLQKNKVKKIVGETVLIHTVDSLELARVIDKEASKKGITQEVLVQVNLSGEVTKSGLSREEVTPLLREVATLKHVRVRGLMTIPPPDEPRLYFRQLKTLLDQLNQEQVYPTKLTELSMGMSHDFEIAIEEGATIVRVGTALFGERL